MHPSFKNPIRSKSVCFKLNNFFIKKAVSSPPFELHEMGWGEFEISIKIFFIEEYEKPIEILHLLKVSFLYIVKIKFLYI